MLSNSGNELLFFVFVVVAVPCVNRAPGNCLCCELTGRLALSASRRTGINHDSVEVSPSACDQLSAIRVRACRCSVATRQQVAALTPELEAVSDGHWAPPSSATAAAFSRVALVQRVEK